MRDRHIQDTRIHRALFFINPSGHLLRAIDIVVLKKLSEVVNVVPIVSESDSLTMEERFVFKQKVRTLTTFTCPTRSDYDCRCEERELNGGEKRLGFGQEVVMRVQSVGRLPLRGHNVQGICQGDSHF